MKNSKLWLIIPLLLVFALAGCDKYLNVEPKQSQDQSISLNTASDIQSVLIGGYNALGSANLWGGQLMMESDLLGSGTEIQFVGTYQGPRQVYTKAIQVDNDYVTSIWDAAYNTTNITNNVLSALDKFDDEDTKNQVQGEAEFIRGSLYFSLVNFYAKTWIDGDPSANLGVPLVLTPTRGITEENNIPRNSVSEVYAQAISDLSDAKAKLPATNAGFATTYAASAILSRVYLMQGDYQDALTEANRVIESNNYSLVPNYLDEFNNGQNTTEDIFAIQVTNQDGVNDLHTFYSSHSSADIANPGRGDMDIEPSFINQFSANDTRKAQFYTDSNKGGMRTHKYDNPFANVVTVRLAEMYLTRAECNQRLGSATGDAPVNDMNRIRERAGLADTAVVDLSYILYERKKELAFEGDFMYEKKRTKTDIQTGTDSFPWNSPKLVFPIPQREIDANPQLTQNEGYSGS